MIDTTDANEPPAKRSWFKKMYQDALHGISRDATDTTEFLSDFPVRGENIFLPYEGKIVRHITVVQFNFNRNFFDTVTAIGSLASKAAQSLHFDTRQWVLLNHVFIKKGKPLNAYEAADNERFLRTLPFIQDARILPARVGRRGQGVDSVDIVIVAKDVFTIGADADLAGLRRARLRLYDANFLGLGSRAQVTVVRDQGRFPQWGYEASLSQSSVGGTLTNAQIGYTNINTGRSDGNENEEASFLKLDRPLVSPDARLAGALELSRNISRNVYRRPDTVFYNYSYNVADVWAGVNLKVNTKFSHTSYDARRRVFVAGRYFQTDYTTPPAQVGNAFDPIYNNRQGFLASATVFKLTYYKTRYIYGFGLTEDLPHGSRLTGTAGWYKQNGLNRPYSGFDLTRYTTTTHGKFFQTFVRGGAFYSDGKAEDVGLVVGTLGYSKLYELGTTGRFRQQIGGSFSLIHNRTGLAPLRVDNALGLPDFNTDQLLGSERFSARTESVLFINRTLFGFKIAPFAFAGITIITPREGFWKNAAGYSGFGGGLRVRNENLIFGTIEARATFFPRTENFGVVPFQFNVASNLRFRYQSQLVRAPDVYLLNDNDL